MDSYCGDNPEDPLKLKYICRFQGITATCMDAYGEGKHCTDALMPDIEDGGCEAGGTVAA